jgi:hypothetical protein
MQTQFRENDRVCLRFHNRASGLPTTGTIARVYWSVPNLYEVRFDGSDGTRFMWGGAIKLAPAERA